MFQALLPHLLTTMEYVRTFLDSSSIHGLSNISTSKKYWRLFWIMVVTFGFCTAGFLIYKSFQSWEESPIKTTIETLPISEMIFPKVTVCPPKNSFTDLNYDVILADNLTKNINSYDLYLHAKKLVKEHTFLDKFNKFKELNDYENWYHGYTYRLNSRKPRETRYSYSLYTYATSGSISTPHFGEKFKPNLIEKEFIMQVYIYAPKAALDNPNIKLKLRVEKNMLRGISRASYDTLSIELDGLIMMGEESINEDKVDLIANFTQTRKNIVLTLNRKVTSADLAVNTLNSMPGFNISWWYSGTDVKPYDHYGSWNVSKTLLFRKYA